MLINFVLTGFPIVSQIANPHMMNPFIAASVRKKQSIKFRIRIFFLSKVSKKNLSSICWKKPSVFRFRYIVFWKCCPRKPLCRHIAPLLSIWKMHPPSINPKILGRFLFSVRSSLPSSDVPSRITSCRLSAPRWIFIQANDSLALIDILLLSL